MRIALPALLLLVPLVAGQQHIVADKTADFSSLQTFSIQQGRATTRRPELNNALVLKKVEDTIRTELVARGLKETGDRPDLLIGFTVGEDRPNGPSVTFNQGVVAIQMLGPDGKTMIWQGVSRDTKSSPAKVAEKLTGIVKKLLSEYPPKKKS